MYLISAEFWPNFGRNRNSQMPKPNFGFGRNFGYTEIRYISSVDDKDEIFSGSKLTHHMHIQRQPYDALQG